MDLLFLWGQQITGKYPLCVYLLSVTYVHTVTVYSFELTGFDAGNAHSVLLMPLVVACWTLGWQVCVCCFFVYGNSDYFIVFFIGVYRFDGSVCMRVVFMYRAAKTTECEVPTAFTRETARPFWLCIEPASPMLIVAYYNHWLMPQYMKSSKMSKIASWFFHLLSLICKTEGLHSYCHHFRG